MRHAGCNGTDGEVREVVTWVSTITSTNLGRHKQGISHLSPGPTFRSDENVLILALPIIYVSFADLLLCAIG